MDLILFPKSYLLEGDRVKTYGCKQLFKIKMEPFYFSLETLFLTDWAGLHTVEAEVLKPDEASLV